MITFFMSLLVSAFAQNACFCETGTFPQDEIKFFEMGCHIWLSKQSHCQTKEIIPAGTSYMDRMRSSNGGKFVIGYVGHWASAYQLATYLSDSIEPLLNEGVSVDIDNTGCLSMDVPEKVASYVQNLHLPEGQELNIKGNQANSIGEWTTLIGSSYNFWAKVSSKNSAIEFPSCDDFEHYACLKKYQLNQGGRCWNESKQLIQLKCCRVRTESEIDPAYYQWEQWENCF